MTNAKNLLGRRGLRLTLLLFGLTVLMLFAVSVTYAHRGRGRGGGNNANRPPRQGNVQNQPPNNQNNNNNNAENNQNNGDDEDDSEQEVDLGNLDLTQFLDGYSLDGSGNNLTDTDLGMAGTNFARIADPAYTDDLGEMALEVDPRFVSNRIYNDSAANLFSENGVTHWGFVWGQFVDHNIGLREESSDEEMMLPFNAADPLEEFENDMGGLPFARSAVADGTGTVSAREQVNTLSSFIDGAAIYGNSAERLDWLRVGSLDGDPENNSAELLLTNDGYLPQVTARGDLENAPNMAMMGILRMDPSAAVVAGDVRANENLGLTAVQTLFAREHNRIVDELPAELSEEVKFAIARRVVAANIQYITYEEFLPSMGIDLANYAGYDTSVDPSITNEFATVGFRAHSMIHGEFELEGDADDYTNAELNALAAVGVEIDVDDDEVEFALPLNVAFARPHLVEDIGLGTVLAGLSSEAQYTNDVMIDNQLRSVLFQVPSPGATNPQACLDGEDLPDCFQGVTDLGVLDMVRAYDHGIPNYNELRVAYGLAPITSFTALTGEATALFPNDSQINNADPINDPDILDFVAFFDANGNEVDANDDPAFAEQRSTVAARLAAIYGDVDNVDAFTGMMAEPHVAGTEFGELQLAMWEQQFSALRDGDRFFYLNDPVLETIEDVFDIEFDQSLAEVIANNSELNRRQVQNDVFVVDN